MSDSLEPCPNRKCLSDDISWYVSEVGPPGLIVYRCKKCGLRGPHALTPVDARVYWNALPRESSGDKPEFSTGDKVFFVAPLLSREAVRAPRFCSVRSCLISAYDGCTVYRELYDLQDLAPGASAAPFPGSVRFAGSEYVSGGCLRKSHGAAVALYRDRLLDYVASGSGDVAMLAKVSDALRLEFSRDAAGNIQVR